MFGGKTIAAFGGGAVNFGGAFGAADFDAPYIRIASYGGSPALGGLFFSDLFLQVSE